MELLERYLQAVRKHLPTERQDDIIAELRANLEAQLDEKEEALGRPLTQAEAEEWVKSLGAPIQVAGGYQPQQYLIGPALFPFYRYAMKLALTWTAAVYAIATGVLFLSKAPGATDLVRAVFRAPGILLTTAAWVTLVVAAVEYAAMRGYIKLPAKVCGTAAWKVSDLPEVGGGRKRPSYAKAVAEAIFGFLWLIYLLWLPKHLFLLLGPGAWYLDSLPQRLAPIWIQFYWAIVALNIVQVVWRLESLWSGRWQFPQPIREIVFQCMGLLAMGLVLAAPGKVLVVLKNPATALPGDVVTLGTINHYAYLTFELIFVMAACKLIWDVAMQWRAYFRERSAGMR